MTIQEKINDWKKYPNALGSEAKVAVIIGEISSAIGEEISKEIKVALQTLSLRGTMRDIASAIGRNEESAPKVNTPSFHEVVDTAASSCGISWAEALVTITKYLDEKSEKLS